MPAKDTPQVLYKRRGDIQHLSQGTSSKKYRSASEADCTEFVDCSTLVYDEADQKVSIVYLELDDPHQEIVQAVNRVKYSRGARTEGLVSQSRVVGFLPRLEIRRDYCAAAALEHEDVQAHATVLGYASKVCRYYQEYNPDLYAHHQAAVERVLPEYKLKDSVFTSGIINKDNPLPYHHDAGNFKNVWSNMLVFKHQIKGGFLAVPEYNLLFELKNNSLLMFDGQGLLHGVTPIYKKTPEAHRFSIVFYSLQRMWQCLPPEEEVKRIRLKRTEREFARLKPDHAETVRQKHFGKRKKKV